VKRYLLAIALMLSAPVTAADNGPSTVKQPPKPGVKEVQVPFSSLKPSYTFELGGFPDWMVLTNDAVWISNGRLKKVFRIDPANNEVVTSIDFEKRPCAGLASGFGSIWVPLCDDKEPALARVDIATNKIVATIPVGPGDSEAGVTTSATGVYVIIGSGGNWARIDPKTNTVTNRMALHPTSRNPYFADALIWVTDSKENVISVFDPAPVFHAVKTIIPTHNGPRFMTAGGGFLWTLNQDDGSLTKIDTRTRTIVATIQAGIPGTGGEMAYGGGFVWATVFDVPLTKIDPATDKVVKQWVGPGGDSVRYGFGSIWLTDGKAGKLMRIPEEQLK
jgi:virginiamycin B lyase